MKYLVSRIKLNYTMVSDMERLSELNHRKVYLQNIHRSLRI